MLSKNQLNITTQFKSFPEHVAIIMDGNSRWARNHGKMHILGHKAGVKAVRRAVNYAVSSKLEALTLYAFSSENWNRPIQDILSLMELFISVLDTTINSLNKHNIRLRIIGDIKRFSMELQKRINYAQKLTQKNNGLMLNIAANYGGRWDIIHGFKQLAGQVKNGSLHPDQIKEETLSQHLCLSDLKPVDLVIRTGGEHRISNFLLWQIAYAEFYFTDVLWPDFDKEIFECAIRAFSNRERRFGRSSS